jgi:hypothetical protein
MLVPEADLDLEIRVLRHHTGAEAHNGVMLERHRDLWCVVTP